MINTYHVNDDDIGGDERDLYTELSAVLRTCFCNSLLSIRSQMYSSLSHIYIYLYT